MGDRSATIDVGRRVGGCCAPFYGESWVPTKHNAAWDEAYTSVPSDTLIHPTLWPQCTNVTDRQDSERSDGVGRTPNSFINDRPKTGLTTTIQNNTHEQVDSETREHSVECRPVPRQDSSFDNCTGKRVCGR